MIRYRLNCKKGHEFEGWFASSAAFDAQSKRGALACPACGSKSIAKSLMTPRIAKNARPKRATKKVEPQAQEEAAKPAAGAQRVAAHRELAGAMRRLRAEIESKSEYVGPRFPEEARKIHYEESPARGIYGEATSEEAKALSDEGIEFFPLPSLPEDHN